MSVEENDCLTDPVLVATFTLPARAVTAVAMMESEGIRCETKDLLTIESDHLLSQAVGGVKVFVNRTDYEKALQLLIAAEFISPEKETDGRSNSFWQSDQFRKTAKIFLIVLMVLIALVVVGLVGLVIADRPSLSMSLLNNHRCPDYMEHVENLYLPATSQSGGPIPLRPSLNCAEEMEFDNNGILLIPRFGHRAIHARWAVTDNKLVISEADTLADWIERAYEIEMGRHTVYLAAENTSFSPYSGTGRLPF